MTVHLATKAGKIRLTFAVNVPVMMMTCLPYCKGVSVTLLDVNVIDVAQAVKSGYHPAPPAYGSVVLPSVVLIQ